MMDRIALPPMMYILSETQRGDARRLHVLLVTSRSRLHLGIECVFLIFLEPKKNEKQKKKKNDLERWRQ